MKERNAPMLSRREFAHRAAMLSASASLVPTSVILESSAQEATSVQSQENLPKLSPEGGAEAKTRYDQVLSTSGNQLTDDEKSTVKMLCAYMQPMLDRARAFPLDNGDAPALYLKPLLEGEKKSPVSPGTNALPAAPTKS
jgi:hypothetical protein